MPNRRYVLVSPDFGAGWSSDIHCECSHINHAQIMAEFQPIIDFIHDGNDPSTLDADHPLIARLKEALGMEPDDYLYLGGLSGLEVRVVTPPYKVQNYDGAEYVIESKDLWE